MAHGKFAWNELHTRFPDRARRFYAETVGWTFEPMPISEGGTYWTIKAGDEMVGGIFPIDGEQFSHLSEHWLAYLEVDDVDRRVAGVTAAGGTVQRAPWTIPGVGRIAIVRDANGAGMGWMTTERR